MKHQRLVPYGFAVMIALFGLTGCPPAGGPRPEVGGGAGEAKGRDGGQVSERGVGEVKGGAKSLEALRRGEAAASGPLRDVHFDFDRYEIRADGRERLKGNAEWLKGQRGARVEIEGHADERGTNEYNLALGAKRAQAAKDYLVSLGIGADRLSTISYGEEAPACREASEECWQRNRRARFVVVPAKPAS